QSNCSFGVTFVPTAPGSANGQLKIEDNASGSPHVVSLTGTALGPVVSLSGNSLTFTGQVVGMTSGSQTLTLGNTGNAPLTISNLAAAGDFAVATAGTNCSASSPVAAAGKCTISVTFTPTTSGNRTGTLTIVDNASGSPHDVALSGMGEDFSLAAASGSSISATVSSGQSATYIVSITPVDGFNQAVVLMCSGAPSEATCSISPSSVTLSGSNATNSTVTVTTTAPSRVAPRGHTDPPLSGLGGPVPLLSLWLLALTLSLLGVAERQRARLILTGIAALVVMWAACGGGGAPGRGGGGNPGTPQGTYTLALTGSFTSGATSVKH